MKKLFIITCQCTFLFLCNMSAYAIGFGLYGSLTGGETTYGRLNLNNSLYINDYKVNTPTNKIKTPNIVGGGGFVIDTNCARNELFNYRIMIGFDKLFSKRYYIENMTRMNLINTFGFGVIRTRIIRLWLGPQLSFHYLYGTNHSPIWTFFLRNTSGNKLEYSTVGIGLGISSGLNINLDNNITLSIEGGMRGIIYYGIRMQDNIIMYSSMTNHYVPYTDRAWSRSSAYEGFGVFSIMFRVRDSFQQKADDVKIINKI